jgi:thiol-disulfide isomerase/thioredoxin
MCIPMLVLSYAATVAGLVGEPPSALLAIGDPAPALDIAHWIKGQPPERLDGHGVHVIEFWATWCGPCVAGMPHLGELQARYGERDVQIIGVSDEPLQTVVRFLSRKASDGAIHYDRIRYALATDPDRSTHVAYLQAARLRGIPVAFLVGSTGIVEWIGHPMELESPLAAVLDGSWDRGGAKAAHAATARRNEVLDALTRDFKRASESNDWAAAIEALDGIIALGPDYVTYKPTRLGYLLSRAGDLQRGYAYARQLMEEAWNDDDWLLMQVAWVVSGQERYPIPDKDRDLPLALDAITRANELTERRDFDHLWLQARIEHLMGRHQAAAESQGRAVAQLEAIRPKVGGHHLEDYEADLRDFRETLRQYEHARDAARSEP